MKKIVSYLFLIFWLFIIFYLSNQPGSISGEISGSIIFQILFKICKILKISTTNLTSFVSVIHEPVREIMHSLEFLILTLLFLNVLKQNNIKENIIMITLVFCFVCASFDEIHQLFVPNRTFQYFDILMDMIGSCIPLIIIRKKAN